MTILERLVDLREQEAKTKWRGTFAAYLELAKADPTICALAHQRIADMVLEKGAEEKEGKKYYAFFSGDLFGLDKPISNIMDYFTSAGKRLEVRKRILLLMGPVGGGKSTIVTLLKRGLESYSLKYDFYALEGCPMREEPLHLIPSSLRKQAQEELGVYIEGDLCPSCNLRLEEEYKGRIEDVRVEKIVFSEKKRCGIGTFTPSDPKSTDITELTGSIDLSTIGEYGTESDPRAYRFDGELNIANRGLMEFIEMLKVDEKFLYNLLTLTQEQSIKTGRFAMIYADEVIVSHSNEAEYKAFVSNKKNEALMDRIIMIKVPYVLKATEEIKIYDKLLKESNIGDIHIAPYTLRVAATFAILTRLRESKKKDIKHIDKLKLYDGEEVGDLKLRDIRELQEEFEDEGMTGLSSRYIINCLSTALVRGGKCINPIDALRALKEGLERATGLDKEAREGYLNFISTAREEFDDIAKREVQKAFVYSFEESAHTLLDNYLDNIEAFCNDTKIKDPITEEEVEPDEKLMRSIEEQIGISANGARDFREEILIRLSKLARKGQRFDYKSHERLKEAIEKKLFVDLKDVVKITTSTKTPDADQLKRINDVVARLVSDHGYCAICANELLKYVGTLLNR